MASGLHDPVGVAFDQDGAPLVAESGAGRVVKLTGSGSEIVVDGLQKPQGILVRDGQLYIVDAGAKEVIAFDLDSKARSTVASGLPVGPPPGVEPKPLQGHAPVLRPAGPVRRHRGGTRWLAVRFGRRGRQRSGVASQFLTGWPDDRNRTRRPSLHSGGAGSAQGHRGRCLSRRLPACRPNTNCVNGFRSAATPCAKRCAGCAKTTSSRHGRERAPSSCRDPRRTPTTSCRSTTWWPSQPRPDSRSNPSAWSRSTTKSPPGPDSAAVRNGWRSAVSGSPKAPTIPLCRTEYYINRAFAAIGRLLQRHTGPIFPLIEDLFGVSIVEVHQEIAAVLIAPGARRQPQDRAGIARAGSAAHLQDVGRRGRTGHGEHPSRVALSATR